MPSEIRNKVYETMDDYSKRLNLQGAWILDVGIAGDPILPGATSPSEKYKWFGKGNDFKTMDIDAKWKPDIVGDICKAPFEDNTFNLVILTQTLEHIWDVGNALNEVHRITRKYAIIDCPFVNDYHPEATFEDYWRISPSAMKNLLELANFKILDLQLRGGILTTALVEKL